jgi:hypothetical protein
MDQDNQTNPLKAYFRQPAVYLNLPSDGKYYPQGTLSATKQLPVFPMTAVDEIGLRTPDALYNGTSVINLVKSCIPDIKDPWAIPMVDFDSILIAIKMASFGNELDMETTCPSCSESNSYAADLGRVLGSIRSPDYDKSLKIGELEIYFKPLTYKIVSENSVWQIEQQRKINQLTANENIAETEKSSQLTAIMADITKMTIAVIAESIDTIKTPTSVVRNVDQIREFLFNAPQEIYTGIRDHAVDLKESAELKPFDIACPSCSHEYQQPFALDQSNFFV